MVSSVVVADALAAVEAAYEQAMIAAAPRYVLIESIRLSSFVLRLVA